jgi:hypothetical protein
MLRLLAIIAATQLHGAGISVTLPEGWQGHVSLERGQAALEASGPDTSLRLDEAGNRPGTSGFLPTRLLVLRPQDFPGTQLAIRRVAVQGRSFVVTADLPDPSALARVNEVLSRVVISAPPGLSRAGRERLERPFRIPLLGAGGRCPESRASRAAPNVATTLGPGPAYPVLSGSLSEDLVVEGAYAVKTLWAVSRAYRGALLIRGRRLVDGAVVRFWPGRQRRLWWRGLWPEERRVWRYGATATLIPRRGCYAFQVDGETFSRRIVFAVS